jgi:PII-like signaling protein
MQPIDMLTPGLAKKITIHLNEDTSASHDFLYNEIFSFLKERGVAGATMIRPQSGFGSHHRVHHIDGDSSEREHLPVRIEFIESKEAADALLPALLELITDGLIEVQDTTILKTVAREEPS